MGWLMFGRGSLAVGRFYSINTCALRSGVIAVNPVVEGM